MTRDTKTKIRSLKRGNWYWIDKSILHLYGEYLKPSGIAVYNGLASFANSETQTCYPTQKGIADLIGVSRKTVMRKIKHLNELGLIRVDKRGARLHYMLLSANPDNVTTPQRCDKKYISSRTSDSTDKNHITKRNNNNIDDIKSLKPELKAFYKSMLKSREELLAWDIAKGLNDLKSLPLYLTYAKKYHESVLRKVFGEVKEIQSEKIKKSRGALFNHLIKKYAQETSKNNGN